MSDASSAIDRVRLRAEYAAVAGVSRLLRSASIASARRWGATLGRIAYRVSGSRRRIALENIAHAFPELPSAEHERIARATFEHFGSTLLEVMRFDTLSADQIQALCEIEGEEHVRQAYAAGRGVIFLSGHFGYWEMHGIDNGLRWRPISVLARPLDNPWLHDMLERIRTRTGNTVIYRQGSVRKILRELGANHGVAMLIDQHLQSPDAVYVNFFGRPAATTGMVASLAHRTGAAVLPSVSMPLPGGRYRMVYGRPIDPPVDDSPAALRDFTQRCADALEASVRQHPNLWLWMHRRWRAPAAPTEIAEADSENPIGRILPHD